MSTSNDDYDDYDDARMVQKWELIELYGAIRLLMMISESMRG